MRTAEAIANDLAALAATGGTVDPSHNERVPSEGYVVALPEYSREFAHSASNAEILRYVKSVSAAVQWGVRYLGVWLDSETNTLYLDVVEIHSERATAERLGRERGEIAIFDLSRKEDIRL